MTLSDLCPPVAPVTARLSVEDSRCRRRDGPGEPQPCPSELPEPSRHRASRCRRSAASRGVGQLGSMAPILRPSRRRSPCFRLGGGAFRPPACGRLCELWRICPSNSMIRLFVVGCGGLFAPTNPSAWLARVPRRTSSLQGRSTMRCAVGAGAGGGVRRHYAESIGHRAIPWLAGSPARHRRANGASCRGCASFGRPRPPT